MSLSMLENMLKERMGLDAASIGSSSVERAVKERMANCGVGDIGAYAQRAQSSQPEMQALIEAIVVPETWFFRDREAFAALAKMVESGSLRPSPSGPLRVLSVPCSSGEEPYTIAMTLQACGLTPSCYRIDAVDISGRALALASEAVYGANSFRGGELDFRAVFFTRTDKGWRLNDALRPGVHLQQGNVLAPDFLPGAALYDVVFCRNLLIYFDRPTQEAVVHTLRRLLKPQGVLFAGSSETGLLVALGFVLEKMPQAFALRPPGASESNTPSPARSKPALPAAIKRAARVSRRAPAAARSSLIEGPAMTPMPKPADDKLSLALRLADQGRLREAVDICMAHVQAHGLTAQSCHLMGLLSKADGRDQEAAAHFRKALYLDPQHTEAMSHLALLLEKQGDGAQAQVLRNRLRRLSGAPAREEAR
jgi:chemotaxis protein methyltransferase WspC